MDDMSSALLGQITGPSGMYARNQQWTKPGASGFNTQLMPGEEQQFRQWVQKNNVPFDPSLPVSDYDMRGFYQGLQQGSPQAQSAIDPNDSRMHYPDYWKTPYHETFSNQSQWATPDAPAWNNVDQLVTKEGNVLFDDKTQNGNDTLARMLMGVR